METLGEGRKRDHQCADCDDRTKNGRINTDFPDVNGSLLDPDG